MDNYTEQLSKLTRSLKGALLEGRAVCYGYALALRHALNYVGVNAKIVAGNSLDNSGGHAWNQVEIDDKWYNVDLTNDVREIRNGEKLRFCLKSDEELEKYWMQSENYYGRFGYSEECSENYPEDRIQEMLAGVRTELDEYRENFGKGYSKLMGIEDYKNIAENTVIEPQIASYINGLINDKGNRENER